MSDTTLNKYLPFFNDELCHLLSRNCDIITVEKHTQILRKGQYVKSIPLIIKGLIRVYITHEDKELLLYHIKQSESCVMSFAAGIKNSTSEIYAQTLEDTELLLLPADKLRKWIFNYPQLNILFNSQYEKRYTDLLTTVESLVFYKMEERILKILTEKSQLIGNKQINISHQSLADDLATSREVVSRVLKKLEVNKHLELGHQSIKIL